jgi:hypothetical protein
MLCRDYRPKDSRRRVTAVGRSLFGRTAKRRARRETLDVTPCIMLACGRPVLLILPIGGPRQHPKRADVAITDADIR